MATKETLNVNLDVETLQELHSSLETLAGKIQWVLDNTKPKRPEELKMRLKLIEHAARSFKDALNRRALEKNKSGLKVVK